MSRAIGQTLLRSHSAEVSVLNIGCVTQSWRVAHQGRELPVVLGFDDPSAYLDNPCYLGVIAGRVANRISRARFRLNGEEYALSANEQGNTLHGGAKGLSRQIWEMDADGDKAVRLTHHSPHLSGGFPGAVTFEITITLDEATLHYDMHATTDRETPIMLAQHSYYNLMGKGPIWDHAVQVPAANYLETDAHGLPSGQTLPVEATRNDFLALTRLGDHDPERRGHDLCLALDDPTLQMRAPNGVHMRMKTDQPGLQLYTGAGLHTDQHRPFDGFCLEPQHYPDAVNQPGFPSIIHSPDRPYRQRLSVTIAGASQ